MGVYGKWSSREKVSLVLACLTIAKHLVVSSLAGFSIEYTKFEVHSTLQQEKKLLSSALYFCEAIIIII